MNLSYPTPRLPFLRPLAACAILLAALAACDSGSDPLAPSTSEAAVIAGNVELSSEAASNAGSPDRSGIFVSVEGDTATATTDSNGDFRLETNDASGRIELRFRRGPIDVTVEIDGLEPAGEIWIRVRIEDQRGFVVDEDRRRYGGDERCIGELSGFFDDDVIVPSGESCTLTDAVVQGNVKALEGARLLVIESLVEGDIRGEEADVVQVIGGTVEGNIQIKEGRSPGEVGALVRGTFLPEGDIQIEEMRTGEVIVEDAWVAEGNLQVKENVVWVALELVRNRVGGNLQVEENEGPGEKIVRDNLVEQDLECEENDGPFIGGPNEAEETEGQCY